MSAWQEDVSKHVAQPECGNRPQQPGAIAQSHQPPYRSRAAQPRVVEISLIFTSNTGHQHTHLQAVIGNYAGILQSMRLDNMQVNQKLENLLQPYGMTLGDGQGSEKSR
jgi:hypothetical protein